MNTNKTKKSITTTTFQLKEKIKKLISYTQIFILTDPHKRHHQG